MKKGIIPSLLLFASCFALDRITKYWALHYLAGGFKRVTSYFNFSLAWNRGVSWSLFSSEHPFYTHLLTAGILSVIVIFSFYLVAEYRQKKNIMFHIMILAGALSNVVDRFLYGAVLDFLQFHIGVWYWPTFNVADMFIVVGVMGIIVKMVSESYGFEN